MLAVPGGRVLNSDEVRWANRMWNKGNKTDKELVAAANAGDAAAFEALYAKYQDWVVRLAFRFTRNESLALDILQDTFAYFLKKFPGFTLTAEIKTFLYPVVRNLSLTAMKKSGRYVSDEDTLNQVPDPAAAQSDLSDLAGLLSNLPAAHREVLVMRLVDDMTLQEIAEALEIPVGTVKSRLHNALATLRRDEKLRKYFGK